MTQSPGANLPGFGVLRAMDIDTIRQAASHYLKHKARLALAPYADMPVDLLAPHGEAVTKRWFEAIAPHDPSDPENLTRLSTIVNEVFTETMRDVRQEGYPLHVLHPGLADFMNAFNIDEMLPRGQA